MKKPLFVLAIFLLLLLLSLLAGEIATRLVQAAPAINSTETNLTYNYDPELGWFPVKSQSRVFRASRSIHVEHNARGFRDHEHGAKTKPRLVFLGDSFTWGFDVEQNERLTENLQRRVSGWEVINLGVCGYGTDQQLLLLQKNIDFYQPDIVFLLFSNNDRDDNSKNALYWNYFKPYFVVENGELTLRGTPVPKALNFYYREYPVVFRSRFLSQVAKTSFDLYVSLKRLSVPDPTQTILLSMKNLVESKGARFLIGFEKSDGEIQQFALAKGIDFVDLQNPFRYPRNGQHWTPEGHALAADEIYTFLGENQLLQ